MRTVAIVIGIGVLLLLGSSSDILCAPGGSHTGGHGSGYTGGHGSYTGGHYYGGRNYYHGGRPYYYGGSSVFLGGYFGFPYYYSYPYYPYNYYYYPNPSSYRYYPDAAAEPPMYVEPREESYWYYCNDPQGYYPYVQSCPGGWRKVIPTPPQPGR